MEFFKELDTAIYQASVTVTADVSGTSQVNFESNSGTRLLITSIGVKMSNTSSTRSTYVETLDSDNEIIYRHFNANMDNKVASIPSQGTSSQADNNGNMQLIPIVNGDKLGVRAFTMAIGETYDVRIRGYIRGELPSITSTGSTGDPTLTTNYARIV